MADHLREDSASSRHMATKVLVSSINFYPDHAGIAVYSTDFPKYLAEQGDEVTVVTAFPYYPKWEKRKEDKGRLFASETWEGCKVLRGYLYVPRRASAMKRLIHEATFCMFAACNFFRAGRQDEIVLFTPPFFLGFVGVFFKVLWRSKLVINIQDLPLDAALALGMVKKGFFAKTLQRLEAWIYRRADQVATISPVMLDNVLEKGVSRDRAILVPNWIDVKRASEKAEKGLFAAKHPEGRGKFVTAYAGNLGIKQGLDLLIELARSVSADERYHFYLIGDGADRDRLVEMAKGLRNVTFLPFMNSENYLAMLRDVDLIFVAQRSGAGNNFFPSKLLGLMSQAMPLLIAADEDSELAKVIRSAGCGVVCPYGDIAALKHALEDYSGGKIDAREYGQHGLKTVWQYDRAAILGGWRDAIRLLK